MYANERFNINPREHIMNIFETTKDGVITITDYTNPDDPIDIRYPVTWTKEDAEKLSAEFNIFLDMLEKFGKLHTELESEVKRKELLTPEELSVWETYIMPFEPFEIEECFVDELANTEEYVMLTPEERSLIRRRYAWRKSNSLKRLPYKRRSPYNIILFAQHFEKLVSMNAPELVLIDKARCLAEIMVLYHFFDLSRKDFYSKFDRLLLSIDDE